MEEAEQKIQPTLKPWQGILAFVVITTVLGFLGYPIQEELGLFGVAITELMLLVMAIGAALIFKQNLKEVFPIKLPKLHEVFGVVIFWMGGFLLAMMGILIQATVVPEEMAAVSEGMNAVMSSEGMFLGILIVSVMPAICEEAVHRGFVLHTFKGVKRPWIIVLSMGVIFGVFHLDLYRFVPTAILGACITWVMLKTENMVCSAIYHGVNNLLPVLFGFVLQEGTAFASAATTTVEESSVTLAEEVLNSGWPVIVSSVGTYLMFGLIALPLMLAGTALMKKGEKIKRKHVAAVLIAAGAMFLIGFAMLIGASAAMVAQGI